MNLPTDSDRKKCCLRDIAGVARLGFARLSVLCLIKMACVGAVVAPAPSYGQTTTESRQSGDQDPSPSFLSDLTGGLVVTRNPIEVPGLRTVYYNDLIDETDLKDWSESHRVTSVTPSGDRYQGPFGPDFVSLELAELPKHKLLAVSFDLYAIKSWDGNLHPYGPDIWEMSLLDGPVLMRTTFSNWGGRQENYPDNYPGPTQRFGKRAAARNTLGFHGARGDNDAVYRVFAICLHTERHLKLRMTGRHFDPSPRDQSWGIANFSLSIAEDLNQLSDDQLLSNWERLKDRDPMEATQAMWTLVSAGDRATDFISDRLEPESNSSNAAYDDGASAESWQLRRAMRALRMIGSQRAQKTLWLLEEPGRFTSDQERYGYSRRGR